MARRKTTHEHIVWLDSAGASSRWEYAGDAAPLESFTVDSFGVVIQEDRHNVLIAPHLVRPNSISTDRQVIGCMTIPKRAIVSRHKL